MLPSRLSRSPFAEGICRDEGSQSGMSRSCWPVPQAQALSEVLKQNNQFRASVASGECATKAGGDCWINRTILERSVFNYGIPRKSRLSEFNALNLEPSLHDLVSWLGAHTVARSGKGLSYLEMGVSSLKNFDTQVHQALQLACT